MYFSTDPIVTAPCAQAILRADAAGHFGHVVGCRRNGIGFFHATFGRQAQPVRDVIIQRTMGLTERHATLRAARRLIRRGFCLETFVNFIEVRATLGCFSLVRIFLFKMNKLQHLFCHSGPLKGFYVAGWLLYTRRFCKNPAQNA